MAGKSWHLSRRTFLYGAGVSLGLPYLECMGADTGGKTVQAEPYRLCAVYFPYGIVDQHGEWGWWPHGEGKKFGFNQTLQPLQPFRDQLTFFQGFHHPGAEHTAGHFSADVFLTGAVCPTANSGDPKNTVSVDQVAADHFGGTTRFRSLVLSSEGGVGNPRMSHTLSYARDGRPIPGIADPREVFAALFGAESPAARQRLAIEKSGLDLILDETRSLENMLGRADQSKLDEFLSSIRELERDVKRSQDWLDVSRAEVSATELNLDASATGGDPGAYLRVMYDLMYHAFRTDSTRVATFQTCSMRSDTSIPNRWPTKAGFKADAHKLAHQAKKNFQEKSRWDRWMLGHFAYFLKRLKETPEGDATLLDRTQILYGSSNAWTHQNVNYPLLLAGGRGLGFEHGQYIKNSSNRPMSDILLTMLQGMGVPAKSFGDSMGEISEMKS